MGLVIGLDIGGTKITAGAVGGTGTVETRVTVPSARAADDVVMRALDAVAQVAGGHEISAVGVGSPGTIDPLSGAVVSSDSKPEYDGANIGPAVGERFDVPYAVTNDVNAAGIGELVYGAAQGFSRALVVAVGTGIGGALLINGRIEEGMHGTAGEVAHLLVGVHGEIPCGCGKPDHLEAVASGPAMQAQYAARGEKLDLRAIAQRAKQGEARAIAVLDQGAGWLGRALAGFANAVDIDVLVLCGGVAQIGPAYTDRVAAAFTGEVMRPLRRVPVLQGALGADAQVIGAATYVRARLGI